jgi:hypothetical protein
MLSRIHNRFTWRSKRIRLIAVAAVCAVGLGVGGRLLLAQANPGTLGEQQNLSCCVSVWGCANPPGCVSTPQAAVSSEMIPVGPFFQCASVEGSPSGTPGQCTVSGATVQCAYLDVYDNSDCGGSWSASYVAYEAMCGGTPWCN